MLTTAQTPSGWRARDSLEARNGLMKTALAHICPSCGVVLAVGTRGRCPRCAKPQRPGSSRPELDRSAWQKLRRAARLRDGNRCVACGSTKRLSVHHAVAGSNLLEDLVTLCSRCHAREHRRKEDLETSHFFKPKSATPTRQVAASFVQGRRMSDGNG
jgi:5-methylcytosine-specific restriction endonuclease McrA